ncbi:MAG: DUF3047 domain-containing protein [Pseudomonadota bacterium]
MRLLITFALAAVLFSATSLAQSDYGRLYLDNFSSSKTGNFPRKWRTWPLQRDEASKVYKVAEENGKRFIKAYDAWDESQQIFFNFNWEIEKRPMLSWNWRATTLPAGAAESNDNTNDSACGVYAVIGQYRGKAIKYVWSTTLAPGTVVTRRDGKLKIKVLDSGSSKVGSWVAHKVNVLKDYQDLFGEPLDKNPSGIGLLTDGNAVHKPAGCDYKNFAISGSSP